MKTDHSPLTLVVADWAIDPHAVVAACSRHADGRGGSFAILVPAWLHGIDWAGDPTATVPCAERQLEILVDLLGAAGLDVAAAAVGDPDPGAAVGDAIDDWAPAHLVLCVRKSRLALRGPLDLAHRVERASGIPVTRVPVPAHGIAHSCR